MWNLEDKTITFNEILKFVNEPIILKLSKIKHLIHNRNLDKTRIYKADLSYPIIVSVYNNQYRMVIDGHHRILKCESLGIDIIKVSILDLNCHNNLCRLFL